MPIVHSRRDVLAGLSLAGGAGVLGPRSVFADEGPPETTTLRLAGSPNICIAPPSISDELLRAEGFIEIRRTPDTPLEAVARGESDFALDAAALVVSNPDNS